MVSPQNYYAHERTWKNGVLERGVWIQNRSYNS